MRLGTVPPRAGAVVSTEGLFAEFRDELGITYPPAHLRGAVADEAQAELEPVRDDDAEDVERELARDERAA